MPTTYHRLRWLKVGTAHPTSATSGPYRFFSDNMLSVTDGFSPPLASPLSELYALRALYEQEAGL
jgi:hypothetical protein